MSSDTAPNTRKLQALLVARDRGEVTAPEFAERCGTARQTAHGVLRRLADHARLEQTSGDVHAGHGRSADRYTITARGEEYLAYKREQRGSLPDLPRRSPE